MFTGHLAVGLAGKRMEPKVSLGTWVMAAVLADLIAFPQVIAESATGVRTRLVEFAAGNVACGGRHGTEISREAWTQTPCGRELAVWSVSVVVAWAYWMNRVRSFQT